MLEVKKVSEIIKIYPDKTLKIQTQEFLFNNDVQISKLEGLEITTYPPVHDIDDLPCEEAKEFARIAWTDEVKENWVKANSMKHIGV